LLLFVYCIPVLEAPRPGRQTKQDYLKKSLCSSVIRTTWGRRDWSGLPHGSGPDPRTSGFKGQPVGTTPIPAG
jgi:hypothetical protein